MSAPPVTVTPMGDDEFRVEVVEAGRATSHVVTGVHAILDRLGRRDVDAVTVVRASFEFLLERESPTQILGRFALADIGRFFPEYLDRLPERLPHSRS